ncbi:ribophorin I [Wolffia australiana]
MEERCGFRGLGRALEFGPLTQRLALPSLLVVSCLLSILVSSASHPEIRIVNAERRIDLTSSIVRAYLTLKVENIGSSDAVEVILAFSSTQGKSISLIKASVPEGKRKKKAYIPLVVKPTASSDTTDEPYLFSISLNNPLKPGLTTVLEVLLVQTHALTPFPAEIGQSETQLVYYHDSAFILSPYHILEQTTFIKTPSKRIESYSREEPTSIGAAEIKYGPYEDRVPYSVSPIIVHFENNNPFAVVEELTRIIEISHWGSVQVTEHYRLNHGGARHKGVFSRLEYQSRGPVSGGSSFRHLLVSLPPKVHSVYYRDAIGNISSSHLRGDQLKSELEIEPRYPLFGGWKASFVIGYKLPLHDFLFESPDGRRYLNFTFGCPMRETVVDHLTIKVVLPEGSKGPSVAVPFDVKQRIETTFSYLDVGGRPTVVLEKERVVPEHSVFFQVEYGFSPISMLAEPLMLVSAFFLVFVSWAVYLHADFSIRKS